MHVEATRLITAWLGHATYGVNALLPNVPRTRFGGVVDPEPEAVTIYNDVDFDAVASEDILGVNPPKRPALVVIFDADPKGINFEQVESTSHQYDMVGGVAYYARDGINRMRARREGGYVLRAVGRSLKKWNHNRLAGDQYKKLNGIKLLRITNVTFVRPAGALPESQMMGIVFLDIKVQDQAPE